MNKPLIHPQAIARRWIGAMALFVLFISGATAQVQVEYWFDQDPGLGQATQVTATTDADGNLQFEAPTHTLPAGSHLMGVRSYYTNAEGQSFYGPTLTQQVAVQNFRITRLEYFWDTDPGAGLGTPITFTPGEEVNLTDVELSANGLTPGRHVLHVRPYGGTGWGPTISQEVMITDGDLTVNFVEYFWDSDPGLGNATPLPVVAGNELNLENIEFSTADLTPGLHYLGIRARGNETNWAPTIYLETYVPMRAEDLVIGTAEYFWDEDPGYGQGTPISITPGQELTMDGLGLSVSGLTAGQHLLGVRYRGNNGWSPTMTMDIVVPMSADEARILGAEYFWNEDPGFGFGTPIDLTPGKEVTLTDFGVPSFNVHGDATLFIRYRGIYGWSPTVSYLVMVDAEGNYTLNATAATDATARNYQTLSDAINDFADRGVGTNVTLTVPTSNTTYELDATGEGVLAQFAALAASLDNVASPQVEKVITFTAAEGSGNTLAITTTPAGLPTVVSALTHTATENVSLTINGAAYNFAAANHRHEVICSSEATTEVALTDISTAIHATWVAQPHTGTTIGGYLIDGEGDLATMTLTNSGTQLDSIAYAVTLADTEANVLATYTYYIYVHPRVSEKAFSGMSPAAGSSLDPGQVTLKWNAVGGAVGGYRLTISSVPTGSEDDGSAVVTTIDTDKTSHTITIETGRTYTWTVTAFGQCDELTSPAMTLSGRLLPDLVVENIVLPEAAEAGNTITVTATVRNNGEGATKETSWTDRLYYTVDSEDFDAAVQAASVSHSGALAVGGSYEVTFTMTVPQVNEGQLRVFVKTDATGKVLESDNDNNHTLSATAATLSPFYMNAADLAALRQFYTDFGGASWNGTQWNTDSEWITPDNWSGVTFNTEGRITAINLSNRGLTGHILSAETLAPMTALTSLNLSYNQIDEVTGVLPTTITSLNLNYQHRKSNDNKTWPGLDGLTRQTVTVGQNGSVVLPSVIAYNHSAQDFGAHPTLNVYTTAYSQLGTLTWSAVNAVYTFSAGSRQLTTAQDADVVLVVSGGNAANSALPATLHFVRGDANLSGFVDVNDVQRTLNYVLNSNNSTAFGLWSANTYTEYETSAVINIQDIVCTVDIVLGEEQNLVKHSLASLFEGREQSPVTVEEDVAVFYADGRKVMLTAEDEVAAFDLELEGVSASQVRLLLNGRDWQMTARNTQRGVRLVVFSPTGARLPLGTTELLRLGATAVPVAVQATSPEAEEVKAGVSATLPTGIGSMASDDESGAVYDLSGRKIEKPRTRGVYVVNKKKVAK